MHEAHRSHRCVCGRSLRPALQTRQHTGKRKGRQGALPARLKLPTPASSVVRGTANTESWGRRPFRGDSLWSSWMRRHASCVCVTARCRAHGRRARSRQQGVRRSCRVPQGCMGRVGRVCSRDRLARYASGDEASSVHPPLRHDDLRSLRAHTRTHPRHGCRCAVFCAPASFLYTPLELLRADGSASLLLCRSTAQRIAEALFGGRSRSKPLTYYWQRQHEKRHTHREHRARAAHDHGTSRGTCVVAA